MKRIFISIIVLLAGIYVYAQDVSSVQYDARHKELLEFIAAQIDAAKVDYPALKDFTRENINDDGQNAALTYKGDNIDMAIAFADSYNPAKNVFKATEVFFLEETGDYILCNISGDADTVARLDGIMKSIPAVKGCTANDTTGDWDKCEFLI